MSATAGILVNGITSKGLYECFRCSIYGAFTQVAVMDGLTSRLPVHLCMWGSDGGCATEQIPPGIFAMGINMCFDTSEMFVSSLWRGDFAKLSTVMFGVKRGSQSFCAASVALSASSIVFSLKQGCSQCTKSGADRG